MRWRGAIRIAVDFQSGLRLGEHLRGRLERHLEAAAAPVVAREGARLEDGVCHSLAIPFPEVAHHLPGHHLPCNASTPSGSMQCLETDTALIHLLPWKQSSTGAVADDVHEEYAVEPEHAIDELARAHLVAATQLAEQLQVLVDHGAPRVERQQLPRPRHAREH